MSDNLKILLCMGSAAAPVPDSTSWVDNIFGSLKMLGHDVSLINFDDVISHSKSMDELKRKELLTNHIIEYFEKNGPFDYFLGFLTDTLVLPELYKELEDKVFTINWTCNAHQFDLLHKINSPHINLNTYISHDHKELYESVGAESYWLPMAANSKLYSPRENKDINISFVGSAYGRRPYYIWRLLQSDIELRLYGPEWKFENNISNLLRQYIAPIVYLYFEEDIRLDNLDKTQRAILKKQINKLCNVGGVPSDKEYFEILGRSEISLNFPESRVNNDFMNPKVVLGCNFRDFEIPHSGSMLLTQNSDELSYFFEPDKEVVSFNNEYEMIDKARYYTTNLSEARKIAMAGMDRAHSDHNWENRFKTLFDHIN